MNDLAEMMGELTSKLNYSQLIIGSIVRTPQGSLSRVVSLNTLDGIPRVKDITPSSWRTGTTYLLLHAFTIENLS